MSTSATQYGNSAQEFGRQRATSRVLPKSLIYVACGAANGGMVLNVSDDGMAISMAIAVGDETYSNVNVRMNGLPQSLEVRGRMAWNLPGRKRAGIQLVDVTAAQREKIREWIALDGVRDVNLLPREEEKSLSALPTEYFSVESSPVELPASVEPVAAEKTSAMSAAAFAQPAQPSLLDMFGGTSPQSLGPLPERFANGEETFRSEPSQGIGGVNNTAFRENEWDLASVTMVPRKKARPGWSTVGFVLLWLAIPCFGLGVLIGRRPLEHWLATHGVEKQITGGAETSTIASNKGSSVEALPKPVAVEPMQIPDSEPLRPPTRDGAANAERLDRDGWRDLSGSAVYGGSGDSKLLNSLSTQEARALKNVPSQSSAGAEDAAKTNTPQEIFRNSLAGNVSSGGTKPNPVVVPAETARNSGNLGQGAAAAQNPRADATKADTAIKARTIPSTTNTAAGSAVAASSNVPQSTVPAPAPANSTNVAVSHSNDGGGNLSAAKSVPTTPSDAVPTAPNSAASSLSVSNIVNSGSASGGMAAAPKSATNVATTVASASSPASTPIGAAVNPVSVNAAASAAPVVAVPSMQPPLRGTVLVARKSDEPFLLKLPAELIPSDESVAARMQRTVMVPAQSRWRGHGPIAKVTIGELLSKVAWDGAEGGAKPRVGEAVTVRAYVDRNGDIEQLKAVSGRAALAPRVMRAVREWQFDQTRVDGKAVDSEVDITVEFRR